MAAGEETVDFFDVYNFELQLREKINELQWKDASLDETQKELSETRRKLYEIQTQLEDERRTTMQLEIQLKNTLESTKRLEEDNMKNHREQIRMRVKCETAAIERNILIDQARIARLENMDFKVKLQDHERSLVSTKMTNEILETSLMELKNSVTRLHTKFHSIVGKLAFEQEQLRKSGEDWMNFAQRIESIINSGNLARQSDKKIIQDLKKQVRELVVDSRRCETDLHRHAAHADADYRTDIGSLHLKVESTLRELRCKLESNAIDDKLLLVCSELRKMDPTFLKD